MHPDVVLVSEPCIGTLHDALELVVGYGLESAVDPSIDWIDGLENYTHLYTD